MESGPASGSERSWCDVISGMRSSRLRHPPRHRLPERGRQLRSSRIGGADEEHSIRPLDRMGADEFQGDVEEMYVATSTISTRPESFDESRMLEDVEVMTQKVRFEIESIAEFGRRTIRMEEILDDRQPNRIAERRVSSGANLDRGGTREHGSTLAALTLICQEFLSELPESVFRDQDSDSTTALMRSSVVRMPSRLVFPRVQPNNFQ